MLHAKDLSPGLCIRFGENIVEISTVNAASNSIFAGPIMASLEEADGINITYDYLRQMGFTETPEPNHVDKVSWVLQINEKKELWSCGSYNNTVVVLCTCGGNYFAPNMEFVHEVQRMINVLTGKLPSIQLPVQKFF